jgi:hypothetical protein
MTVEGPALATRTDHHGALRIGDLLASSISDARFLVLNAGSALHTPKLDGVALIGGKRHPCSEAVENTDDCNLRGGRRYTDSTTGLTLLCIQPGCGALHYEHRPMK